MHDLMQRTIGPHIAVRIETAANVPPAKVDPAQLELAVLNLAVYCTGLDGRRWQHPDCAGRSGGHRR